MLVGIDGLGGSGKTTLAHEIVAALRDLGLSANIISIDDFSHRNTPTWDDALFRRQVLPHLEPPTEFTYDVHTWDSLNPVGQRTVSACDVLVVEGVSVLHPRSGAPWDVTIWVESPAPVRRARLNERDGAALAEVWEQQWLPSEINYATVEITWRVYRDIVTAYREPHRYDGKQQLQAVLNTLHTKVPIELNELRRLGKTFHRRATDILAYLDHPGTSNAPTEAIDDRLEHLRGIGHGFGNHTNYITRALLETGGFRQHPTP